MKQSKTSEWSEPLPMVDWLTTNQAQETMSEAYSEASEALADELKTIPAEHTLARTGFQAAAYTHIDCAIDDAYQLYVANHPHTLGYLTELFENGYGKDGI